MTAARRYKIGDQVSWLQGRRELIGEVVCYRDVGSHQVLTVKVEGEDMRSLFVRLETGIEGVSTIQSPPATIDEASRLAEALLSGVELRMPVGQQINILATGVLSLAEAARLRRSV
jgi:hypothetical protein